MVITAFRLGYDDNVGCNLRQFFMYNHFVATKENKSLKQRQFNLRVCCLLSLRKTAFVPWPNLHVER